MDVDYIQDGLAIHEGMPAGDKLGALTRWDGASGDMARL